MANNLSPLCSSGYNKTYRLDLKVLGSILQDPSSGHNFVDSYSICAYGSAVHNVKLAP